MNQESVNNANRSHGIFHFNARRSVDGKGKGGKLPTKSEETVQKGAALPTGRFYSQVEE